MKASRSISIIIAVLLGASQLPIVKGQSPLPGSSQNEGGLAYLRRAIKLNHQHDYRGALAELQKGLEAEPQNVPLLHALTNLLITCRDKSLHDGKRALEYAKQAYGIEPNNPEIKQTLALAYAETKDFEQYRKLSDEIRIEQDAAAKTAAQLARSRLLEIKEEAKAYSGQEGHVVSEEHMEKNAGKNDTTSYDRRIYVKLPLDGVRFHWRFQEKAKLLAGGLSLNIIRGREIQTSVIFRDGVLSTDWEVIDAENDSPDEMYFGFISKRAFHVAERDKASISLFTDSDIKGIGPDSTGILRRSRRSDWTGGVYTSFGQCRLFHLEAATGEKDDLAFLDTGDWNIMWKLDITSNQGWMKNRPPDDSPLSGQPWSSPIDTDPSDVLMIRFRNNAFIWDTIDGESPEDGDMEGTYKIEGNKLHMISTADGKTSKRTFEWRIEKGKTTGAQVLILDGEGKHYQFERGHPPKL